MHTRKFANLPVVLINFVMTMEGLISFMMRGHMGGGDISGSNPQDRFIMALLRASVDAVVVGANTLREEFIHLWTPTYIDPEHRKLFEEFRRKLRKSRVNPYTIFVTGSGHVLPENAPIPASFLAKDVDVMILTTKDGKKIVKKEFTQRGHTIPEILAIGKGREVDLKKAFKVLKESYGVGRILVEGGPRFNGAVIDRGLYDEVFLTVAPFIIGTTPEAKRPTFVNGFIRTPERKIEHELVSVKMDAGGNFLFKHYLKK